MNNDLYDEEFEDDDLMPTTVPLAYDLHDESQGQILDFPRCPIILIHGFFWNKFMLKDIAKGLSQKTKRKVYSLDLRNHGDSKSSAECDMLLMLGDVKRFLEDRNLDKVTFVCHSFSSTIAYLLALEKPEAIEKLVLVDHPPFLHFTESYFLDRVYSQFQSQNRFLNTLDSKLTLDEAKKEILSLVGSSTEPAQKYFLKKVSYDLVKENGLFKWRNDLQFLSNGFKRKAFTVPPRGSTDHPILIIRCVDSARVSDSTFQEIKKRNPRAELVTFPDTTHLLMFEETEKFIAEVVKFLR